MKPATHEAVSRDHKKLNTFHLADALAICVYRETANFPPGERYGLQSQLRRAAVSIPTNIVEGSARRSEGDYVRFLGIALSSACEADYLIDLCQRLSILPSEGHKRCKKCSISTVRSLQKLITSFGSD
jgi:four helix bundle protein